MGEHVRQAHDGRLAVAVLGVVALDHAGDERAGPQRRASMSPTSAWSTPISRRSARIRSSGVRASPWTCRGTRVCVDEHELADVVQ